VFTVRRREAGRSIVDCLRARLAIDVGQIRNLIQTGNVFLSGKPCRNPHWVVRPGQQVRIHLLDLRGKGQSKSGSPKEKSAIKKKEYGLAVRFQDAHVVVVDKPAGLTTMRHREEAAEFGERGKRFLPATLADLLPAALTLNAKPRAVHRLDKDTSGLVVFATTPQAEGNLGKQFRAHTVERLYVAVVRGRALSGKIESWLVSDRGDGRRGSSPAPGQGQRAVTHVRVVEELGDFTLVECRLETGRTHQVRIHLGEAGTPLCGERIYDRPTHGQPLADTSHFRRVALHAATLGFVHPATGQKVKWNSPLPADMAGLLTKLRHSAPAHKNKTSSLGQKLR
jgi:23S rRNA pseudouridine1911/1915/1917 synthase